MVLISSLLPTSIYVEYQYNYNSNWRTLFRSQHTNTPQLTPNCRQDINSPTKTALWSQPSSCRQNNSGNILIHSNTWQFSGTYNFCVLPRLSGGLPIYDLWVKCTACNCGTDYCARTHVTRYAVTSFCNCTFVTREYVHTPMIWWSRWTWLTFEDIRWPDRVWLILRWTRESIPARMESFIKSHENVLRWGDTCVYWRTPFKLTLVTSHSRHERY
jgi:hypothetical protein